MADPLPPSLHFAFAAFVDIGAPQEIGETTAGRRRVIPITGGQVEGPRLQGEVVPGGADWQLVRSDGTVELVARYTLRASDGTLISVVNRGLRRAPPEVLVRLAAGEIVDPALYYFRATPSFSVMPGPHGWLADTIFVATGERQAKQVVIKVFALG